MDKTMKLSNIGKNGFPCEYRAIRSTSWLKPAEEITFVVYDEGNHYKVLASDTEFVARVKSLSELKRYIRDFYRG